MGRHDSIPLLVQDLVRAEARTAEHLSQVRNGAERTVSAIHKLQRITAHKHQQQFHKQQQHNTAHLTLDNECAKHIVQQRDFREVQSL